jgi:hypothetical protein
LVFTHAASPAAEATMEQAKEMSKQGGYVEFSALNLFYGNALDRMLEFIVELGLTTVL